MALGSQISKFIPVLTDLEAASQYILQIIMRLRKIDCFSSQYRCCKKLLWNYVCGSHQETK